MPRVEIALTQSTRGDGVDIVWTAADATEGMYWDNTGEDVKIIIRTGGTDTTPTINAEDTIDGRGIADTASAAVGTNNFGKSYGPYPNYPYADSNDQGTLDLTADTDVFVAAVKPASLALASS